MQTIDWQAVRRAAVAISLAACSAVAVSAQVRVRGSVLDRSENPIQHARLVIEMVDGPTERAETQSDEHGSFRFDLGRAGEYRLTVTHAEFFPIKAKPIELVEGENMARIELIRARAAGTVIDVRSEQRPPKDEIAVSREIVEEEIDSLPMTRSTKQRIQGVAAVLPGVVRTAYGDLHLNGSPARETNWSLDGFNLADPASGELEMTLGVESVKSMDLQSAQYSAALGKGAGGAMVLDSSMGGDEFTHRFTNFVPGVELNRGLRFRDWRPRYTMSGPLASDRIRFFNALDVLYEENLIPELPRGQDSNRYWSINNSFRVQAQVSRRQTLSSGLVTDYFGAPRSGLSPLSPIETTLDQRARRHFFNLKDQVALSAVSVLDFGYAAYRSSYRGVPQGNLPYKITADGRAGNYPIDMHLLTGRDEFRANLLSSRNWLGAHELRAGLNFSHSDYSQDIDRSPIEYYRVDNTRSSRLAFAGNGRFSESNLESGAYLQDRWTIRSRLVAEMGLRMDRDRIVAAGAVTPRFSIALAPPRLEGSRLSAGVSWIPSTTYFRIFTRHRDQHSVYTTFAPDGETPLGPPDIRFFELDRGLLAIPSTRNLSAGWQQRLPGATDLAVNFLRKRLNNGYAQFPTSAPVAEDDRPRFGGESVRFQLQNSRQDSYDSVELSLTRPLLGAERWFVSYTYSRSWSNAALEVETNDPILFSDTEGRLAWDVPHRLVSWASFPIGEKMSVAYLCEWRDGLPFSVHDDNGKQVGRVNSWRLPRFFSLNVHVERKLSFLGHRWALRPGVDNLTNRPNYRFVNNNVDSPEFLDLSGRSPIKLVIRVRWLGKSSD